MVVEVVFVKMMVVVVMKMVVVVVLHLVAQTQIWILTFVVVSMAWFDLMIMVFGVGWIDWIDLIDDTTIF